MTESKDGLSRDEVDATDNVKIEPVGVDLESGREVGLALSLKTRIDGEYEWVGQLLEPDQAEELAKELYTEAKKAREATKNLD